MNCPKCNTYINNSNAQFCPKCGASLAYARPAALAAPTAASAQVGPRVQPGRQGSAAGAHSGEATMFMRGAVQGALHGASTATMANSSKSVRISMGLSAAQVLVCTLAPWLGISGMAASYMGAMGATTQWSLPSAGMTLITDVGGMLGMMGSSASGLSALSMVIGLLLIVLWLGNAVLHGMNAYAAFTGGTSSLRAHVLTVATCVVLFVVLALFGITQKAGLMLTQFLLWGFWLSLALGIGGIVVEKANIQGLK